MENTDSDIFVNARAIIAKHFTSLGLPPPIADGLALTEAGLSSLQIVDLVLLLEQGLGVQIPDRDITLESFKSTGTILEMLSRV